MHKTDAKIALEMSLIRPLGQAIVTYLDAWGRKDGVMSMMDRLAYVQMVEAVLERHYATVMLVMTGREVPADPTLREAALSMTMAERYKHRAGRQAQRIMASVDLALVKAMQEPEKKDDAPKKNPFSVSISVRLRDAIMNAWQKAKSKLKSIANMETEATAEDTTYEWVKQNEANSRIVKVWNNPMDGRERPSHHNAHGQERFVDEAFDVGVSKLRFPGDQQLGAPLGEIINCRCWLTYFAVKPDGSRIRLPIETPRVSTRRPWQRGDRFGDPTPIRPTSLVTLNGRTRARIVLGDGRTQATMEQVTPSTIVVRVGRSTIARADARGADVTSITIAPGQEHQGLEDLIRNSVRHSATRKP